VAVLAVWLRHPDDAGRRQVARQLRRWDAAEQLDAVGEAQAAAADLQLQRRVIEGAAEDITPHRLTCSLRRHHRAPRAQKAADQMSLRRGSAASSATGSAPSSGGPR
jgi:hypothetical protein